MTNIIVLEDEFLTTQIGQVVHFAEQEVDHLVELRAAVETRDQFSDKDEDALWRIKGKIEFILTSIKIDREKKPATRLVAAE